MSEEESPSSMKDLIAPVALIGGGLLIAYAVSSGEAKAEKKSSSKACDHADSELEYGDLVEEGMVSLSNGYARWQIAFMPSDEDGNKLPRKKYCKDPKPYVGLVQTPTWEEYAIVAESDSPAEAREKAKAFIEQYR